jgi:hypothetical protein
VRVFSIDFDFDQHEAEYMKREALAAVLADAREKVHFLRCAEHDETAQVSLDGEALHIAGCCEAFTYQAAQEITNEHVVQ